MSGWDVGGRPPPPPPGSDGRRWLLAGALIAAGTAGFVVILVVVVALASSQQGSPEGSGTAASESAESDPAPTDAATDDVSPSEQESADNSPGRRSDDSDERSAPTSAAPKRRTFLVVRVVDGDTLELGNGETVRLVGIDTPERGECGYEKATARLRALVGGKRVALGRSDEDRDRYDRLLRYVDLGNMDAGLRLVKSGLAIARYDSRAGYGRHPREGRYIAADRTSRNVRCPRPQPAAPTSEAPGNCGYVPCIPAYPPDLDCADVDGPIRVTGSDPHGLDRDGDGVACE